MTGTVLGIGLAFVRGFQIGATSLDQDYVDGVSITHGDPGNRTHIWSFATGGNPSNISCPCDNNNTAEAPLPPAFVQNNYFCDALVNGFLWDGMSCTTNCCTFNNPPWFNAILPSTTTNNIEVAIRNEANEATTGVIEIQIFVA